MDPTADPWRAPPTFFFARREPPLPPRNTTPLTPRANTASKVGYELAADNTVSTVCTEQVHNCLVLILSGAESFARSAIPESTCGNPRKS
jgi:hypothetical protein